MKTALDNYMKQAGRFPLFTKEEEKAITTEYFETKCPKLRNKIVEHNLRLVIKLAFQYKGAHIWDLIQEGNMGLIRAVEKFNPNKNVTFGYYAHFWIKAKILRYIISASRPVKFATTDATRKLFFNISKTRARLRAQGIEVSNAELAEQIGVKESDVRDFDMLFLPIKRIFNNKEEDESPMSAMGDRGVHLPDRIDVEDPEGDIPSKLFEKLSLKKNLDEAMTEFSARLNDKYRMVFERRFLKYDPDTLESIGQDLSKSDGTPLSRERVRQIESVLRGQLQKLAKRKELTL